MRDCWASQALRRNDDPYQNFGVEVLYRFADIDLLTEPTISRYFGFDSLL